MKIAIIGASNDHEKFGNKAVRAYSKIGWQVFPVNLHEKTIEGLKCYKSVKEIKQKLDRISIYLPPAVTMNLIDDIVGTGVKEVYLNPGAESDELVREFKRRGIKPLLVCSIVAIGLSPSDFD